MSNGMIGMNTGGYAPPMSSTGQAIQSYRESNTLMLQKIINQKLQQMSATPSTLPLPPGREYQEIAKAINYTA